MTLVKNNEIEIFTLKGEPARDEFLAAWEDMEDSESTGASLRWAVVGGDDDRMKLQLQALPAPASVLNDKPTLRADNVPVILLEEMPIHCELYDGENMAGPVPTLFGSEEDSGDHQGEHHHSPRGPAEAGQEILLPGVHPS